MLRLTLSFAFGCLTTTTNNKFNETYYRPMITLNTSATIPEHITQMSAKTILADKCFLFNVKKDIVCFAPTSTFRVYKRYYEERAILKVSWFLHTGLIVQWVLSCLSCFTFATRVRLRSLRYPVTTNHLKMRDTVIKIFWIVNFKTQSTKRCGI